MKNNRRFQVIISIMIISTFTLFSSCTKEDDLIVLTPAEKVKEEIVKVINDNGLTHANVHVNSKSIGFNDPFTFHGTFIEVEGIYYNLHHLSSYSLYDYTNSPYNKIIILHFN